jgi:hypothetical protein
MSADPARGKRKPDKPELETIPGIGPNLARDLEDLGYRRVADLRGGDAEKMYAKLCAMRGAHIDRCVLYVFRLAVYYASHPVHEPELLKWWKWKDAERIYVTYETRQ